MRIATYQFLWCLCLFQWPSSCLVCVLSLCMWSPGYLIVLQYPWAWDFDAGFYQWRQSESSILTHTSRVWIICSIQVLDWVWAWALSLWIILSLELKAILCLPQWEHLSLKFLWSKETLMQVSTRGETEQAWCPFAGPAPPPSPTCTNKLITLHFTSFGKLHYSLC